MVGPCYVTLHSLQAPTQHGQKNPSPPALPSEGTIPKAGVEREVSGFSCEFWTANIEDNPIMSLYVTISNY